MRKIKFGAFLERGKRVKASENIDSHSISERQHHRMLASPGQLDILAQPKSPYSKITVCTSECKEIVVVQGR